MNAREKLRNALRAYDQIEPAQDALERIEARAGRKPRPLWRGHALVTGLAVVFAMGAIVGARLMGGPQQRPGAAVSPEVSPTADVSLLPSPSPSSSGSPSASPSPSPSPVGDQIRYTSADGTWEVEYPSDWLGPSTAEQSWSFQNVSSQGFRPGFGAPDGFTQVQFNIHTYTGDSTQAEILAEDCKDVPPENEVFDCKMVTLNGHTWTWTLMYSEEEWPVLLLASRTLVGDKLYNAFGYVYGDRSFDHEPMMKLVREIFSTFVLEV